jgi:hypothetical protein
MLLMVRRLPTDVVPASGRLTLSILFEIIAKFVLWSLLELLYRIDVCHSLALPFFVTATQRGVAIYLVTINIFR